MNVDVPVQPNPDWQGSKGRQAPRQRVHTSCFVQLTNLDLHFLLITTLILLLNGLDFGREILHGHCRLHLKSMAQHIGGQQEEAERCSNAILLHTFDRNSVRTQCSAY